MQNDLDKITLLFSFNKLSLNVSKTVFIIFFLSESGNFKTDLKVHKSDCARNNCDCDIVEQCNSTKYLGLYLDENLSWKIHISHLKSSLRKTLRIFFHLKYFCPSNTLKQIYYSLINSKLEYGISLYGGSYYSNLSPIIILQKKYIRLISNANFYEHSLPLFLGHKILPFRYLYIFKVLSVFYKLSGNSGPTVDNIHHYITRQVSKSCFRLPKPNCTLFKKCFVYLSVKFFNVIPNSVKISQSLSTFKKSLKDWLMSKTCEEVERFYTDI